MNWTVLLVILAAFIVLFVLKQTSFVSAKTARKLLQQGALVVDVRTPDEYRGGHLPDAVNIPLDQLRETLPRQVPDKSRVLLLHCLSGGRSGVAKHQLKGMGYTNSFNLGSYARAQKIVKAARQEAP
jgi:phage shock protein E